MPFVGCATSLWFDGTIGPSHEIATVVDIVNAACRGLRRNQTTIATRCALETLVCFALSTSRQTTR